MLIFRTVAVQSSHKGSQLFDLGSGIQPETEIKCRKATLARLAISVVSAAVLEKVEIVDFRSFECDRFFR